MNEIIHCIGDSHVSFFSGRNSMQPQWPDRSRDVIPLFKSYRLGAVLAWSLPDFGTSSLGKEKLLEVIETIPKNSYVLFCFGEIDSRVHILKQAKKQKKDAKIVAEECAKKYFQSILEIKKDFKPIVWGAVPSTISEKVIDNRYPHVGTCRERNEITKVFNDTLEKLSTENEVKFVSIFDKLVTEDYLTKDKFYIDKVHLSQRAMPLAIKEIRKKYPSIQIKLFNNQIISRLPFYFQYIVLSFKSEVVVWGYLIRKNTKTLVKKVLMAIFGENTLNKMRSYFKI